MGLHPGPYVLEKTKTFKMLETFKTFENLGWGPGPGF